MQIQNDKRGVAYAMIEEMEFLQQQEPIDDDNKKMYRLININSAEDELRSLAIDSKSHESVID